MSKSRGNVVIPDQYIEKWGADAFRSYLMFLGPFEEGGDFRDASISGVKRFLDRLWASVNVACEANGTPDRPGRRCASCTRRFARSATIFRGFLTTLPSPR